MSWIPTLSAMFLLPTIMLSLRPHHFVDIAIASWLVSPPVIPLIYSVPDHQINLSEILLSSWHYSAHETGWLLSIPWINSSMSIQALNPTPLGPRHPCLPLHSPMRTHVPHEATPCPVLPPLYLQHGVLHSASLAPRIQPIAKGSLQPCRLHWPDLPSSAISPPYY